jgi:hypothetical protein
MPRQRLRSIPNRFNLNSFRFIAWFYGIMIQMFYDDHEPPHFHARYGRAKAIVRLSDGEIIAGELPPDGYEAGPAMGSGAKHRIAG